MAKIDDGEIDQDFLLESIAQHGQASKLQEEDKAKSQPKRKKNSVDYGSVFLKRNEMKIRQCVYISRDIHTKISKIVNLVAEQGITVGGYIDNVLSIHLEENKDEINKLYCQDRGELI